MRHGLPNLLSREGENGGQHEGDGLENFVHCALRRTAQVTLRILAVKPILNDVKVEVRHVDDAEVVNGVENEIIGVVLIGFVDGLNDLVQTNEGPFVKLLHILIGHHVGRRVEIVEVAENIPGRVADFAVNLGELLQDFRRDAHVVRVVGRGDPEAQNVGAVLSNDLFRRSAVSKRLAHLLALAVDHHAAGQNLPVGGGTAGGNRGQQGGLEPAAVLVVALEVHVGRPALVSPCFEHGSVAGAGVEPDIHDVGLLRKLGATAGAGITLRQDFVRRLRVPGVAALFFKESRNRIHRDIVNDGLAALLAVEHRDGDTPEALPGNAPIAAVPHHGGDALLAPGRIPLNGLNGLKRRLLEPVDRTEPLFGDAEQNGVLAAPAVGILVDDLVLVEERAGCRHVL
ncbi:hypothetical protein SDC9_96628 [bioreactor metagenome]|uniref:Uncharacterized protein n=1 Tax=bioreactor metagenome TaxID=1076179 RepID=A0A645AJR0_9ZZZZ